MARKQDIAERIDPEVTKAPSVDLNVLEIRGRGTKWNVFYPEAENQPTFIPVYDKEGKLVGSLESWVATNKYTQCHETCTSLEAAKELAEYIHPGCEVKVVKVGRPGHNLKNRKKDGEEETDDTDA